MTAQEIEFVEACLLGDGTLSRSGKHFRLRIEHGVRQLEYVEWKYQKLQRLCISPPVYVATHRSVRFGTIGHPQLTIMRQAWYRSHKCVPPDFRLTPESLAIWFMDDGTRKHRTVDISAYGFSKGEIQRLCGQLAAWGVTSTINGDSRGFRLYVRQKSYPVFKELVKPYIHECMTYKLP